MSTGAGDSSVSPDSFDLVVLGAGNAGQAAASAAREAGWRVAIVEARDVGGTCPLRGCVPKKVLVAAAEALDVIARAHIHAIEVATPRLDWAKLIARERTFVDGASASMEKALADQGIELIHGEARFLGPNRIDVGGRTLAAKKILIATGSRARSLSIPGHEHLVTSDDLLVDPKLPAEIVFIGAGVIAFEFAHVFARAGVRVTILQHGSRALPALDEECVDRLVAHTRSLGVTIELGVEVLGVEKVSGRLRVDWQRAGTKHSLLVDRVVNSAGRIATTEALDLDVANIAHDGPSIHVDEFLQSTSNSDVYVAGDAHAGAPQLSALATHAGALAAHNLVASLGGKPRSAIDLRSVPSVVFSIPALASVGLTAARAKALGHAISVQDNDMHDWRAGRTYAEPVAFARVIVDEKSGELLGAHLLGHGAAETIHAFAAIIRRRGLAHELRDPVYAYPTFHADLRYLVRDPAHGA